MGRGIHCEQRPYMCSCQLFLRYLSFGKAVFIWLPCYQSAHWLFLCLRKTKLWNFKYLSFTVMYEALYYHNYSIAPIFVICSWSFILLFSFSSQLLFSFRIDMETSRPETSLPGNREHQGHLERLTLSSLICSQSSLPLPVLYPQWIVLKAWNNPGKVTLFDSAVSLNYVSAFISKSKYKS